MKLALAALGLNSLAIGADPRWTELKSANFVMYSSASEANGRDTLRYFEQARMFFAQALGSGPAKALPVRIIAFNSKKEYEPYRLNNFASAYYHGNQTTDYIVLSEAGVEVFPVAIHEYFHLVARHAGLKLPPWMNEGMAELFSTMRPSGDKILVGELIAGRHQALLRDMWVPLSTICAADHNSPYYNERSQAGSLYNEGWALTHMLILSTDYRPGFPKFMGLVSSGTPTAEALTKIYGKTIEEVDLDLQRYLRGGQFRSAVYSQQLARANFISITAAPASAFDVRLVLAELLNRPGKEQETRATLQQLAEEDPKRPEAFAALGYIAWSVRENDEAVKEFRKAYELGDRNPSLLWDFGRLVRGRDRAEAIRVLTDLTKQDPARVDARLELAAVQLVSKQPGDALETLKPVKNGTKEEAPRLFLLRAHAQLDSQLWGDAKESAQALVKFAVTDGEKSEAERILKFLDERGSGIAVAPPVMASERPALRRRPSITGMLAILDCAGKAPKMIVETAEGKKVFLIDDPNKIVGSTIDMTCGAQKKVVVRIDYVPASQPGVDGLVRGISFEP